MRSLADNSTHSPGAPRSEDSFSLNVTMTFVVKAISLVIGVATGIIVARVLGPAGKGSYALIASFPGIVFCFVHLGIAEANVYYLKKSEVRVGADIIRANTIAFTVIISSIIVLALLCMKSAILSIFLKDIPTAYFYIILLLMPFFVFETFGSSLLVAFERFKLINSINLFIRVFDTVAVIIVLYAFRLGLLGVILVLVSTFVLKCAAFFFYGFWEKAKITKPDVRTMINSVRFGLKSHAQSLTGVLHYKIDLYILAALLSSTEVGYYSVAVALVSLIFFVPDSIGYVMFPKIAALESDDAHGFTARICRNTLFITALPAIGILAFGKVIIKMLYGAAYLPACDALYLLIPGTMAMCIYKILTRNFTSRNRQQITVATGLIGLVLNVGLNLILIPRMGIAGAALATTSSYTTTSFLLLFFFLKESGYGFRDSLFIKHSDFAQLLDLLSRMLPQKVKA